jgi:RimJ/RimL family protein N-acetyltransferase
MRRTELQIGNLLTQAEARGRGLATYAVQQILQAGLAAGETDYWWYVVAEDNASSIKVAMANDFELAGRGRRLSRWGVDLFAKFVIDEWVQ